MTLDAGRSASRYLAGRGQASLVPPRTCARLPYHPATRLALPAVSHRHRLIVGPTQLQRPDHKSSQHRRYARLAYNSWCSSSSSPNHTVPYRTSTVKQPVGPASAVQRGWWTGNGEHWSLSVFYGSVYDRRMAWPPASMSSLIQRTARGTVAIAARELFSASTALCRHKYNRLVQTSRNWLSIRTKFSRYREDVHRDTFNFRSSAMISTIVSFLL